MIEALRVLLDGELVGALSWREVDAVGVFQYHPDFIASGREPSPLMMPLREAPYVFPELARTASFLGLPGLIADSLPERFGNQLLSAWLQRRGLTFETLTPLERLTYLGSRGMGALEYEPDLGGAHQASVVIDLPELVEIAQEVLSEREQAHGHMASEAGLEALVQVGTSAGGAKAKAVIAWHPETGEVRSGQVPAPPGFQYWLLKFDEIDNEELATRHQIGRIEMAYHLMAIEAGIDMMECRLMPDGDRAHFMTRRFDRGDAGEKYHVQTFSALTHQDRNPPGRIGYESLFATARRLGLGADAGEQLYRRMVFNILARNQDDHAKNHAFIMDPRSGEWHLAPAYDLCFAYKPGSRWIDQHQMRCNDKRDGFTRDDLLEAARAADLRPARARTVIDEVKAVLRRWATFADEVGLTASARDAIEATFRWI